MGVYPLSFAQYVYGGPPEAVAGTQWVGDTGVDETFTGQMSYPGGGMAQFAASFRNPYNTLMEISGREGRLVLNRPFTDTDEKRRMLFFPADGEAQEIPVPEQALYIGEVEDMHAAILDGSPPYLSLDETRDHVRTVLALYESARRGEVVQLYADHD